MCFTEKEKQSKKKKTLRLKRKTEETKWYIKGTIGENRV
jgi:hypothetical protein